MNPTHLFVLRRVDRNQSGKVEGVDLAYAQDEGNRGRLAKVEVEWAWDAWFNGTKFPPRRIVAFRLRDEGPTPRALAERHRRVATRSVEVV